MLLRSSISSHSRSSSSCAECWLETSEELLSLIEYLPSSVFLSPINSASDSTAESLLLILASDSTADSFLLILASDCAADLSVLFSTSLSSNKLSLFSPVDSSPKLRTSSTLDLFVPTSSLEELPTCNSASLFSTSSPPTFLLVTRSRRYVSMIDSDLTVNVLIRPPKFHPPAPDASGLGLMSDPCSIGEESRSGPSCSLFCDALFGVCDADSDLGDSGSSEKTDLKKFMRNRGIKNQGDWVNKLKEMKIEICAEDFAWIGEASSSSYKIPPSCFPQPSLTRSSVSYFLLCSRQRGLELKVLVAGVLYRDLKPENLLLREDGQVLRSDFHGAVRARSAEQMVGGGAGLRQRQWKRRGLVGVWAVHLRVAVYNLGNYLLCYVLVVHSEANYSGFSANSLQQCFTKVVDYFGETVMFLLDEQNFVFQMALSEVLGDAASLELPQGSCNLMACNGSNCICVFWPNQQLSMCLRLMWMKSMVIGVQRHRNVDPLRLTRVTVSKRGGFPERGDFGRGFADDAEVDSAAVVGGEEEDEEERQHADGGGWRRRRVVGKRHGVVSVVLCRPYFLSN
ncbi:hypothetical protein G2W53_023736 [Senna tora]|uniref:Protein kinase domain-containing protein n=1 Tax=Senna tora TaxID=362788 RepID=A0A834TBY7_9FABA|nr:hypothetical protein G2W53_023736 [Senna tora]